MKIALVYGNDGSDVRVGKTCHTLVKLGHDVHFVGWDRRPDLVKESHLEGVTRHVIQHAVPQLGWTVSGQIAFTRHAVRTLWTLKPDVVCAVNEDNVLRIGWLRGLAYRRLVCDVFDSHRDRNSDKGWPARVMGAGITWLAHAVADRLIATDEQRFSTFGRARRKTIVIGNYPFDPGPRLSRRVLSGPIRLFVSGTLSESRGVRAILSAVEDLDDVRIIAAGWAADGFTSEVFLKHRSVEYLGHRTPAESLEIAAGCDAMMAFYAPICRNNILASPNKIYDALSVGRPTLINSEAKVSDWVVEHGVGFACPFDDVQGLRGIILQLRPLRDRYPQYAIKARHLFEQGYSWEAMEQRLARLYEDAA